MTGLFLRTPYIIYKTYKPSSEILFEHKNSRYLFPFLNMTILIILPKPVPEDITVCIKLIKTLIFKQKEWK